MKFKRSGASKRASRYMGATQHSKTGRRIAALVLAGTLIRSTLPLQAFNASTRNHIASPRSHASTRSITSALENNLVQDAVNPVGTKINMFDYWTEDNRFDRDYIPLDSEQMKRGTKGINKGESFKFRLNGPGTSAQADYNDWSGSGELPKQGIVQNVLHNGYPRMSQGPDGKPAKPGDIQVNSDWYGEGDETDSLNYLFDPNVEHEGKKSFENVTGLLQVDKKGYYYYDSTKNFASLEEKNRNSLEKEENNEFKLYNAPAVFYNEYQGQFFPFNLGSQVFNEGPDGSIVHNNVSSREFNDISHYHGLTMTTRFIQENDGKKLVPKHEDMQYKFSGDDDVWVFIDDVLVADLGGIHDAVDVNINFATGDVKVSIGDKHIDTTIKQAFEKAGRENTTEWRENTFANDTYHTLRFFYLERANNESNMSLQFNIASIPESSIVKNNQDGDKLSGVEFGLYSNDNKLLCSGSTDRNGKLVLKSDDRNVPLSFKEISKLSGINDFILREERSPGGHRKIPDLHLHYDVKTGMMDVAEKWQTGAYAQPIVTATVPVVIGEEGTDNSWDVYEHGSQSASIASRVRSIANHILNPKAIQPMDGSVYALIYRYIGDTKITDEAQLNQATPENWVPVKGDSFNGWEMMYGKTHKEAIEATNNVMQPYMDGSYKIQLSNIPGNGKSYYNIWKDMDASAKQQYPLEYTVAYFYKDMVGNYHKLNSDNFIRDFSVGLSIPNVENSFKINKLDESDNIINEPAKFGLFNRSDVVDGVVKDSAKPVSEVTTQNGVGIFRALQNGDYYLVETEAPDGYAINANPVQIKVTEQGVYANAGSANDNVKSEFRLGKLVKNMHRFSHDDGVDATLYNMKAQLQTSQNGTDWNDTQSFNHYKWNANGYTNEEGTIENVFESDEGWTRLSVKQCSEHDLPADSNSSKENLGDMELSQLFAHDITVKIRDRKLDRGVLIVKKVVEGIETDRMFNFKVTLYNAQDNTVATNINGAYDNVNFVNGVAEFALSHDESIRIKHDDFRGLKYVVEEVGETNYESTSANPEGIIGDEPTEVVFTNTFKGNPSEKVTVPVEKVWDDKDNMFKTRPDAVTVHLVADNVDTSATLVLNEENQWKGEFIDLPKYNGDVVVNYTITEDLVEGYESTIESVATTVPTQAASFRVTNRLTEEPPQNINIKIKKIWDCKGNAKPGAIKIKLVANGKPTGDVLILEGKEDTWEGEFVDLPKYDNEGVPIVYSVSEVKVPKYASTVTGSMEEGFVIKNTYDYVPPAKPEPEPPEELEPTPPSEEPEEPEPTPPIDQPDPDSGNSTSNPSLGLGIEEESKPSEPSANPEPPSNSSLGLGIKEEPSEEDASADNAPAGGTSAGGTSADSPTEGNTSPDPFEEGTLFEDTLNQQAPEQEQSDSSKEEPESSSNPKTGDGSDLVTWFMLLVVSALVLWKIRCKE